MLIYAVVRKKDNYHFGFFTKETMAQEHINTITNCGDGHSIIMPYELVICQYNLVTD